MKRGAGGRVLEQERWAANLDDKDKVLDAFGQLRGIVPHPLVSRADSIKVDQNSDENACQKRISGDYSE